MTPKQRAEAIKEMLDQVIELTRCYALWWYFLNKPNAERYAKTELHYPDFFITMADSLRKSFFIVSYRLFDKHRETKSLIRLIDDLKASNPSIALQVQRKIDMKAPILEKVTSFRHKVFGHRNKAQSPKDVFTAVKFKPKEMAAVVRLAQDIISTVAGVKTREDLEMELSSYADAVRDDAHSLMQVLEKYTE